jgi:hypothetical protein
MPTAALPGVRDQKTGVSASSCAMKSGWSTRPASAASTLAPFETIQAITDFPDKLTESCDGPLIPDIGEQVAIPLEIPLKFFTILHVW